MNPERIPTAESTDAEIKRWKFVENFRQVFLKSLLVICFLHRLQYDFSEILRVVDSLQLTAQKNVATPVDWKVRTQLLLLHYRTGEFLRPSSSRTPHWWELLRQIYSLASCFYFRFRCFPLHYFISEIPYCHHWMRLIIWMLTSGLFKKLQWVVCWEVICIVGVFELFFTFLWRFVMGNFRIPHCLTLFSLAISGRTWSWGLFPGPFRLFASIVLQNPLTFEFYSQS